MADLIDHYQRVRSLARGQESWTSLTLSACLAVQAQALSNMHSVQASKVPLGTAIPDPKPLRVWAEEVLDDLIADRQPTPEAWRILAEYCADRIRTHALEGS
jgi:hypothetical protein